MPTKMSLALGAVLVLAVLGTGALATSLGTVPQSEVGFQVGGGPLDPDRRKVKSDLLEPGRHVLGPLDGLWRFPSNRTLRFQDFEVTITTLDGKKADIRGQVGFRFVGEKDPKLAREFAEGVGARRYRGELPGASNEGWQALLDQLVSPEITATLKEGFGRVYCADFEPACRSIDPRRDVPQSDPERVYEDVSGTLEQRVTRKLGDAYLQDLRVRVSQIVLPREVQANIDQVTAEQAKTKSAEQSEQTAKAEARAIETKARALRANRDLIALEVAKECRGGEKCTLIVDASGDGVGATVRAGR